MARTPTVYRWDDPGAPDLSALHPSNNERDLMHFHTVLKACLVTGYGAKAAAGWTMPHEETTVDGDGNRFVLTNAAVSGSLLYEGGTFSGNSSDHRADTLWACSTVPNMDSPVNAWSWNVKYADRNSQGTSDVFHKTGMRIKKDCDAWVIIANENTCIVVCGRAAYDFNPTNTSVVNSDYSCFFMFGAMHDGFGGVLAPDSGNFYIAGGSKGGYNDYSDNTGIQSDLLTSIQGITGLAKDKTHVYFNISLSSLTNNTYFYLELLFTPKSVYYTQFGPSNLTGTSNASVRYVSCQIPAIRYLEYGIIPNDISRHFTQHSIVLGESKSFLGNDFVFLKDARFSIFLINLSPSEWGA